MVTPKQKLTVQFATASVDAPIPQWYEDIVHITCQDQKTAWWWTPQELNSFKQDAFAVADVVCNDYHACDDASTMTPEEPAKQTRTYFQTMRMIQGVTLQDENLPSMLHADLCHWVREREDVRGLERFCCDVVLGVSRERKLLVLNTVIVLQEHLLQNPSFGDDERCKLLRTASESVSYPAKRFASIMATADEEVVALEAKLFRNEERAPPLPEIVDVASEEIRFSSPIHRSITVG